jgi:hypothetical protein
VRHPAGCWLRDRVFTFVPESLVAKQYVAFALPPELS